MAKIRTAKPGEGDSLIERPALYVDAVECRSCAGSCCLQCPGIPFPEDFGRTPEEVRAGVDKALMTGFWQVDYWEPDGTCAHGEYIIRPAVVGDPAGIEHPSWAGRCTFLGAKGCLLPATRRPYQCRHLEPKVGGMCTQHGGEKRAGVEAWADYSEWLCGAEERLADTGKDNPQ